MNMSGAAEIERKHDFRIIINIKILLCLIQQEDLFIWGACPHSFSKMGIILKIRLMERK